MSISDILDKFKEKRTKCEIFSRCMGYIRCKDYFNIGKKQEFHERKYFTEEKAVEGVKNGKRKGTVRDV